MKVEGVKKKRQGEVCDVKENRKIYQTEGRRKKTKGWQQGKRRKRN